MSSNWPLHMLRDDANKQLEISAELIQVVRELIAIMKDAQPPVSEKLDVIIKRILANNEKLLNVTATTNKALHSLVRAAE